MLCTGQMPAEEEPSAGGELFENACRISLAGIVRQHPDWDEAFVQAELRHRPHLPRIEAPARP
jgi:hypothetical protein